MKRLIPLSVVALMFMGLFFGCGDDNDDNPLTPGSPDDSSYLMFIDQFGGVDEINRTMFTVTFGFIDLIREEQTGPVALAKITGDPTFTYHVSSGYWYCTWVDTNSSDEIQTFVDSIQFKEGTEVVQWPDMEALTEVRSYVTLTVTGPAIDTAIAHQNIVITTLEPGSDTIYINGTGDLLAGVTFQDIDGADTTTCTLNLDYDITLSNLLYHTEFMFYEDNLTCPRDGSVAFNGTFDFTCTGAETASVTGVWNVVETFNDGDMTVTITHNDNVWTITDQCGHPDFPEPFSNAQAIAIFMEQFYGVDSATGSMFNTFYNLVGMIMEAGDQITLDAMLPEGATAVYHGVSGYWLCEVDSYDETTGHTTRINDSIQFRQGEEVVRWPDNALLTEVRSGLDMTVEGPEIETASGYQIMTITRPQAGSDTLIINGTTGVFAAFAYEDIDAGDTTYCDIELEFDGVVTNLRMNTAGSEGEAPCPYLGTINYAADVAIVFTGALSGTVGGSWTVGQTFDHGSITTVVNNGSTTWNFYSTCD